MDKETIKAYIRWLEEATDEELEARRLDIASKQRLVTTQEGKADIKLALRLLDEEVVARLGLSKARQG